MSLANNFRISEQIAMAQSVPAAFSSVDSEEDEEPAPVGAELLMPDPPASAAGEVTDTVESIYPLPSSASASLPRHYGAGCHPSIESETFRVCTYGDTDSDFSIMIAGDSHAAHWASALTDVATANGWAFKVATKSTCPLNSASFTNPAVGEYTACSRWNESALEYLKGPDRPDVLLHTNAGYSAAVVGGTDAFIAGGVDVIEQAQAAGVQVIALRDTPAAPVNIAECAAANPDSLSACAFDRDRALRSSDQAQPAMVAATGIDRIDMTEWICPQASCASVIGGILVWRDAHHLTNEYSQTLATPLADALRESGI